ncbi:hypothetical protein FPV67DRAFT_1662977 [Lyophyllum atratum]|nr:hypothetical protein FPV67DRAFT_1662977 [Lyophyllum atratum]
MANPSARSTNVPKTRSKSQRGKGKPSGPARKAPQRGNKKQASASLVDDDQEDAGTSTRRRSKRGKPADVIQEEEDEEEEEDDHMEEDAAPPCSDDDEEGETQGEDKSEAAAITGDNGGVEGEQDQTQLDAGHEETDDRHGAEGNEPEDQAHPKAASRPRPTPKARGSAPVHQDPNQDPFVSSRAGFRRSPAPGAPPPPIPTTALPIHDDDSPPPPPIPTTPPPIHDDDPHTSGSDFEETELEKERRLARVPDYRRPVTIEEQDEEDEVTMEQELRSQLARPRSRTAGDDTSGDSSPEDVTQGAKKGKRKSKPSRKGKERVLEDQEGDEAGGRPSFKPGPIAEAAKEAAFAAHADYQCRMEEIAGQYNKPVLSLYQLVGQSVPNPRHEVNRWNAFQAWYGVHGQEKREKGTKASVWARFLADEYEKHLKSELGEDWEDPDREAECMEPIVTWFKDRIADYAPAMKADGKFGKVMTSVADKFIQYSAQAYETYGIHVFGFAINTDVEGYSLPGVAWGGTQAYAGLRNAHKATIATQLGDYQGMLRVEEMKLKGLEVGEELFAVSIRANPNEKERDCARRVFTNYLRSDIGKILYARGMHSLEDCKKIKMPWVAWGDLAFEHKLCIVNWPPSVRAPARGFELHSPEGGIPHSLIKESNRARLVPDDDSSIMIVEWTDEHEELAADDPMLGDVPLVVNTNGRPVISVSDSPKYQAMISAKTRATRKGSSLAKKLRNKLPTNAHLSEEDIEEIPPPSKKKSSTVIAARHAPASTTSSNPSRQLEILRLLVMTTPAPVVDVPVLALVPALHPTHAHAHDLDLDPGATIPLPILDATDPALDAPAHILAHADPILHQPDKIVLLGESDIETMYAITLLVGIPLSPVQPGPSLLVVEKVIWTARAMRVMIARVLMTGNLRNGRSIMSSPPSLHVQRGVSKDT